ncbi:cupin domain-containing protein [Paracoccus suum]|uniref:Cupin domain-containing protein n=1 Tax=Paracoccus suum TaxID=2259340 RepID=A0A344PIA4_9RHOB|nr:cupin domain-containing protein [Paracoccus suum]AXC49109.1 cupin domain-containing protein [Paracoccus suum]
MAVFRKDSVPVTVAHASYPAPYTLPAGRLHYRHITEAGGLTQFGAALETLLPGGQSSQMHWEEHEDEFMFMLSGTLTVVEDGVETIVGPGDSCCWRAGTPVGHMLKNHSDAPATYLIVGSRRPENICHYPGLDLIATPDGPTHLDGTPYPKKGDTQ